MRETKHAVGDRAHARPEQRRRVQSHDDESGIAVRRNFCDFLRRFAVGDERLRFGRRPHRLRLAFELSLGAIASFGFHG